MDPLHLLTYSRDRVMNSLEMAKISKRLNEGLSPVWRLRMDQNLPECRTAYYKLLKSLKVDPEQFEAGYLVKVDSKHLDVFVDAFLLHISLLRSEGKILEAIEAVDALENILNKRHVPLPFQFCFQKGNNFLYRGDSTTALELFVRAKELARNNEEKVIALSNTLYCLQNLGQSFDVIFSELRKRIQEIPANELMGVRTQFEALEQRCAYREGDFQTFFAKSSDKLDGQEVHLRFFCSELPYHTYFRVMRQEDREKYFVQMPNLHQKSYRMRTLQGVIHASDFEKRFRESDLADRLYLWTWRWMTQPEQFSFEKIVILLENMDLRDLLPRLTAEDYCLVRNALLWIAFFVPRYADDLDQMARNIKQPGTGIYPLFEFERDIVEYLRTKQRKDPESAALLKKLENAKLWKSPSLRMRELIEGATDASPLRGLAERISLLLNQTENYKKGVIYVDLGRRELIWDGGRKRIISDSMCLALDLMRRKECLTFEEFLSTCFGIHRFDSIIHNAKVYNLIARIKERLQDRIIIKTKYNRIYCYGPWERVEFQYPTVGLEDLMRRTDLKHAFKRENTATSASFRHEFRPTMLVAAKRDNNLLSRQELEAAIGKSRATANRIIQNWVEQGIVKKVGRARNTKYLVLTPSSQLPAEI